MVQHPVDTTLTVNLKKMALREGDLEARALVFTDQYESSVLDRCWETRGRERDADRYRSGTLLYDSASTLIHAHHQVSLRTADIFQAKYSFKQVAALAGVKIRSYRADNHIFNSDGFIADCNSQDQSLDFFGVGAHHQNGVAERAIQTFRLRLAL